MKPTFIIMIIISLLLCFGSLYEYLTLEDLGKAEIVDVYVYYQKGWHYQGINYKINNNMCTTMLPYGSTKRETIEDRNNHIILGSKENVWKPYYSNLFCYNNVSKQKITTDCIFSFCIASFFMLLLF